MIIGLILRNFKSFKNQHYIPIATDNHSSWFIGENGVGKSTILQALDTLLNQNDINRFDINNEAISQSIATREPFIVPIFLINKNRIKKNNQVYKILETISNITWQLETDDFHPLQRTLAEKFVEHRTKIEIKYRYDKYFLIPIGFIKNNINEAPRPYMSFFESIDDYKEQLLGEEETSTEFKTKYHYIDKLNKVLQAIRELYNFIYLPAEITVDSYSKIEDDLLQSLLGEDLHLNISKIIKRQQIKEINSYLNEYIEDVSGFLKNNYSFKKPSQRQNLFTQRHMVNKIIETYFSDKILHFKNENNRDTPIHNLSSGEKRKALLDLAEGFLNVNPKKGQQITILAIDEPELSLHATACFKQFEKIKRINELGVQILSTTHWYGFLPAVGCGTAIYISPNQNHIKSLKLEFYKDELTELVKESNGSYIDTLEVKSNHDLVQSIVYSITAGNEYKWLICEGKTDKKYLEAHLQYEQIENLIILPVGGSITLKKIYKYLILALDDRKKTITGRVFCLLDTDEKHEEFNSTDSIPAIKIRRMILSEDLSSIDLVKTTDSRVSPKTEIEDALEPLFFHEALVQIGRNEDPRFNFVEDIDLLESDVSGGALNINRRQKLLLQTYFNTPTKKVRFCNQYIEILEESDEIRTPSWIEEIAQFFSS